jgi:hypothetical protein
VIAPVANTIAATSLHLPGVCHLLPRISSLWSEGDRNQKASIQKGDTPMRLIPALAVFVLSTLIAIRRAVAQGVVLKADIPFAFTVGDTAMPAGEYTVSSRLSGVLQVQNTDKHVTASVTTASGTMTLAAATNCFRQVRRPVFSPPHLLPRDHQHERANPRVEGGEACPGAGSRGEARPWRKDSRDG